MSQKLIISDTWQDNPCTHCGACCAYFRVSFYWAEEEDGGGTVPVAATEKLNDFFCCMKGTNQPHPRCMHLQGDIGKTVSCGIYEKRPSPCREFEQSWEYGQPNEACDRARAAHGLAPLTAKEHLLRQANSNAHPLNRH